MRAVVQRVRRARVSVGSEVVGEIGRGLLVLLGIHSQDDAADVEYIGEKLLHLRVFDDPGGRMNLSVRDVGGGILLVSQFTLYGDARKGRRPDYRAAARSEVAVAWYERVAEHLREAGVEVAVGGFGQEMLVSLDNDGPVTLLLDSSRLF